MKTVSFTGKVSDFLKIGVAAAGRGDLDSLQFILQEKPDWLRRIGSHGRTMLWEAAYRGRRSVVEFLVEKGADINARGCHYTPLLVDIYPQCAAAYKQHQNVSEYLLGQGAIYDISSAIYLADIHEVSRCVREVPELVSRDIPQNDSNITAIPLHYAVASRNLEIAQFLIQHASPVVEFSESLIRFAIFREHAEVLELLIDAGADVSQNTMRTGHIQDERIIELLASHGGDVDINKAENGWPPIVYQSRGDRGGDVSRIADLIDKGANIDIQNYKGQSALHCASKAGFVEIVRLLLHHGAQVDVADGNGETPLMTALRSTVKDKDRLREVMESLILAGADLNKPDKRGQTPLNVASRKKDGFDWEGFLLATRSDTRGV